MIWSNVNHFKAWLSNSWNRHEFVIGILWRTRKFPQCARSSANIYYRKFQFHYVKTRCNGMWMHRRREWYQVGFRITDICKKNLSLPQVTSATSATSAYLSYQASHANDRYWLATIEILIRLRGNLKADVKWFQETFHANEEFPEMNSDRENRHIAYGKRNRESRSVLFNKPAVPIIYPASGLQVEPLDSILIPLTITEVNNLEIGLNENWNF